MENIYGPRDDSHLIEPEVSRPRRSGADQHNALDNPHPDSLPISDEEHAMYAEFARQAAEREEAEWAEKKRQLEWAKSVMVGNWGRK